MHHTVIEHYLKQLAFRFEFNLKSLFTWIESMSGKCKQFADNVTVNIKHSVSSGRSH